MIAITSGATPTGGINTILTGWKILMTILLARAYPSRQLVIHTIDVQLAFMIGLLVGLLVPIPRQKTFVL
jgi:hypothetical protein